MIRPAAILAHAAALRGGLDFFSCDLCRDGDRGGTMVSLSRGLLPEGIPVLFPEMLARAAAGHSLYVRTADTADGALLLDDLTADSVAEALRDGLPALCVTETSPGNHQLWFLPPGPDTLRVRAALLRRLAGRYGGDPMAADPRQVGRLAGTPNTKPGREGFPCALLRTFEPPDCPKWLAAELADTRIAVERRLRAVRARDAEAAAGWARGMR